MVGTIRADDTGHISGQLFPAAVCHLSSIGLGVEPVPCLGDADSDHFIFFTIDIVDKIAHRNAADLVFAGHTAEQQGDAHFFRLHDNSLLFIKPLKQGRIKPVKMPFWLIIQYLCARCKQNAESRLQREREFFQKTFQKSKISA